MLHCHNIEYRIGDFSLTDFSLDLARGEYFALLGPSGSGKSIILELIAGLRKVRSGTITCNGLDCTSLPPQRRPVGILFQDYALFPHKTVYENIAFPLQILPHNHPHGILSILKPSLNHHNSTDSTTSKILADEHHSLSDHITTQIPADGHHSDSVATHHDLSSSGLPDSIYSQKELIDAHSELTDFHSQRNTRVRKEAIDAQVKKMAEELDISEFLNRMPDTLSGGEKQRVALARTMITHPDILLLDEPLSALDASLRSSSLALFSRLSADGLTILHVTHDFSEASTVAHRIAIIEKGHLIQSGTPSQISALPASDYVSQLVNL